MKKFSSLQEDLRNWFNPNHPKGGWKRVNSKGEAIGPCAREPGEPKPKCMSNAQRASLSKKERASAVRRKRAQDPNPERKGEPINVKAKVNEDMEILNEKNKPTNPELWSRAISLAKSKFDVYPSAYANGWASKWYKSKGGGWKSVSEAVKNEYDEGEYDQEGDMAKSDLRSIMANAKRLHDMIGDADNLPEWCQNKITLAEDYISTVTNYMTAEMNESIEEATSAAVRLQRALQREKEKREREERAGAALLRPKPQETPMKKEEVVAEGLADAQQKIQDTINKLEDRLKHAKTPEQWDNIKNRIERLQAGLKRSQQGVAEGLQEREDDEYHIPTRHHVQVQVSKGDGPKQYRKATVRAKEPDHAVSAAIVHYKQQGYTVHDHKYLGEEVEQIDEGRPSQRHPLEGHEYHKKTNAELEYIAKDAHKAAEAMKSHNTTAENKYRDQANDSATVRYFRQKNGMPDWYKKKYGHVKESTDDKPPFDKPYKKVEGTVTDKSGAKHSPMSRVRDIARQALKKQSSKMSVRESLEESRKAEIVKEIMKKDKKKDNNKFEAEPELSNTVIKADN